MTIISIHVDNSRTFPFSRRRPPLVGVHLTRKPYGTQSVIPLATPTLVYHYTQLTNLYFHRQFSFRDSITTDVFLDTAITFTAVSWT